MTVPRRTAALGAAYLFAGALLAGCSDTSAPEFDLDSVAQASGSLPMVVRAAAVAPAGVELISNGSFINGSTGWKQSTRRTDVRQKTGEDLGELIGTPLGAAGQPPSGIQMVARFCGYPYAISWTDTSGQRTEQANCSDKLEPDGDITIPASGGTLSAAVYGNFGCTDGVQLQALFVPRGSAPKIPAIKLTPADLINQRWQWGERILPAEASGHTYRMVFYAQTNVGSPCTDSTAQKHRDTWFLVTDISLRSR